MKAVVALFAAITAGLEDMHAVAVDAQASDITADEGTALLAILRERVEHLRRLITEVV